MMGLLAGTSCDPLRDRDGCWKDGDEAFIAYCEAGCAMKASCTDYNSEEFASDQEYYDACVAEYASSQSIAHAREAFCFDACLVDNCVELIVAYAETCADADYERFMEGCNEDTTPFWDFHSSPARSCTEGEQGWE